jgi:hypothetical protein
LYVFLLFRKSKQIGITWVTDKVLKVMKQAQFYEISRQECKWQSNNAPCKGGALGQMAK